MAAPRHVALLGLAAGIGAAAYLVLEVLPGPSTPPMESGEIPVGRTTIARPAPAAPPEQVILVDPAAGTGARASSEPGTTVIHPLEVEFSLALDRAIDMPEGAEPIKSGANAFIQGSMRGSSGKPLPATVTFTHGPNEGRVLLCDAEGRFGAGDLWEGLSIVRLEAPSGLTAIREVRLAQRRTTPVHVSFAGASFVSGTITDDRGAPLEGAEVTLDGKVAYTDEEGLFSFGKVAPGPVFATVRKAGFAITRRKVSLPLGRTLVPEDFVIRMQPASTLELVVGRRAGEDGPTVAVLMPATSGAMSGEAFPWYEVNPVVIPSSGRVEVPGLPPEAVIVRAFRRGAVQSSRSVQARLQRGRKGMAKIDFDPAPLIRGVVLDGGAPVRGARVSIEAANQSVANARGLGMKSPRFAIDLISPRVATAFDETVSDAKGRFNFTRDPGFVTTYYARASADGGRRVAAAVVPDSGELFVLELQALESDTGTVEIDLPGRFQGLPLEVRVQGTPRDPRVLPGGEPLEVDGLGPGAWVVRARWRGQDVVTRQVVEVPAGGRAEVEGELPRGAIEGQSPEERRIREMQTRGG